MILPVKLNNINPKTNLSFQAKNISKRSINNDFARQGISSTALLLAGATIAAGIGVTAAIAKRTIRPIETNFSKSLKKEMSVFAKDVDYRKSILKSMNLPERQYYRLRSIIGIEEFDHALETLSKDKENFLPGKKVFRADNEPIFPNRENVKNYKFAANLHMHTKYSDGQLSVQELLDQAAKYGDERVAKLGKDNPFYIAITDHDTMEGCREAINIIYQNPQKYENVRLILGVENTVVTTYPECLNGPVYTHMLSYGINPFNEEIASYYSKPLMQNRNNIADVLDIANKKFLRTLIKYEVDFNIEEFDRFAPEIKYRNLSANYLTKDYLQFKLIYSSMVEKNKALLEGLNLNQEALNFASPRALIEANPDYSGGKKYYDFYLDAIKEDLKSKTPVDKHKIIDQNLRFIPEDIIPILEEVESSVGDKTSSLYVKKTSFPSFEEAINQLIKDENIGLGIAHPAVVFPLNNLKGEAETIKFYNSLYADFKKYGQDKAKYAEDHYAVYFEEQSEAFLRKLQEESEKQGLIKTGGLDTHIADIFSSK